MFKYLWIITLVIPYVIWTYFSVRNIYQEYKKQREYFDIDDCEIYSMVWTVITGMALIVISLISLIKFAEGFE